MPLKKFAMILLLLLLLFNQFGYRFVFEYQRRLADQKITSVIDSNNFAEAELITITLPLNNGYQSDRPDFERVKGEISYNGVIYTFVKRKVLNGELILKCLPNYDKMEVLSGRDGFLKLAYDYNKYPTPRNSDHKMIPEYQQLKYYTNYSEISFSHLPVKIEFHTSTNKKLPSTFLFFPERPPIWA